ncbi:hypothetical protein CEP54_007273 [Fusarium duplospermum]|uniref:DhaK domain-containing protein n=1 Tax=Fusarium duplospermum TaxID=1325734 RepID=A0A428Q239_9HYPO|nr:hypothetical protein CEP54_007273 [Fusarium duplospermum]
MATKVVPKLGERGINPRRVYSGTFMTSLDGPGFSITCLRADAEILSFLDAPTSALGWTSPSTRDEPETRIIDCVLVDPSVLRKAISGACHGALEAVPAITHFNTIVGGGDCGLTLQRGCETVLKLLEDGVEISDSAFDNLVRIAAGSQEPVIQIP